MTHARRVFLLGALAILVFDTVGSLAARSIGFPYATLIPVSFFIQATVGFFAARTGALWTGTAVAAAVAGVEATVGWAISWVIGPGRPPEGYPGLFLHTVVTLTIVIIGAILGLIGGGIARLMARRSSS